MTQHSRGVMARSLASALLLACLLASCDVDPQQWLGPLVGPTVPVATSVVGQPTTSPVPPRTYAIVRGRVVDSSGRPIADVPVDISIKTPGVPLAPMPIKTNAQGSYESQGLEPATYEFVVSAPGYEPKTVTITVNAGQQPTLDFVLMPADKSKG